MRKPIQRRLLRSFPISWNVDNADGSRFEVSFNFCFSYREVAKIEKICGKENWFIESKFWKEISNSSVLPVVVWGAIIHEQPEFDSDEGLVAVSEYLTGLDAETMSRIIIALGRAYTPLLPENTRQAFTELVDNVERGEVSQAQAGNKEDEAPTKAGIGTASEQSGPSADTISASATTNSAA